MFLRPFEHQRQRTPGQLTFDDVQRADVDQRFVFRVQRMEMRWSMIFPEHLNQDAVEGADGGHRSVLMSVAIFTRMRMHETSEVYVRLGGASTRVRLGRPWCRWFAAVDLSAGLAFTLYAWLFSGYSCVLLGFASA